MNLFAYMDTNKPKENSNASVAEATKIYDSFQVLPKNKGNICPMNYWKTKTRVSDSANHCQKIFLCSWDPV